MDIAALISSFAQSTFTVTRTARGSVTRGKVSAGSTSSVTITATWHPASGRDLDRLPEGRSENDTRVVYTTTELYVGGQDADYEADKVSIGGDIWEVQHVERWQDGNSSRVGYRCIVQLV